MTRRTPRTIKTLAMAAIAAAVALPLPALLFAQQQPAPPANGEAPAAQAAPATQPAPDPKAADALKAVHDAYGKLDSLALTGSYSANFDVGGEKVDETAEFTASYAAPNKFRHEMKQDLTAGSTGEKIFLYAPSKNVFAQLDAPKGKMAASTVPPPVGEIVLRQNPALGLALLEDPLAIFTDAYGQPRGTGTKDVDGKTYDTITLAGGDKDGVTTLLVDPATHLLRRIDVDLKSALENRGATDVKHAAMTVNYSEVATDKAAAPDQFAWAPPEGAREVPAAPPAGAEGEPGQAAMALVGKPAPAFTLKDLDGKDVALADQKGSVVVLDFWATWCGPCVAAMPGIDKLNNELGPKGLKVFAVNVGEDKDTAQGFMTAKGFKIPTLLDADSKVSEQYKAMAIPQTVVIGKDGVVTKVFVGSGGDTEHKLREAVDAAMKG